MIPELERYYLTNYSKCNLSYNYLATREGLSYPSHVIQAIAAPVQILSFFTILKKTPKVMKTMKWPLFINHSWSVWIDFGLCTLSTPYIFLPTTSFIGVGILSFFGLSYIPQMAAGALSALCEFICLSSRSNAITDNRFRMTKKCTRVLYHTLVLFLNLTVLLFMFFTTTEESQKLEALKIDPCPTKEFFRSPVGYYNQGLMNLGMIFYGLNGLVESLAILSVYRPYRNAVKDILNFRKSKEPKVQTIPVREVCGNSGFGRTHLRI
ncbi:Protein CBG26719 [Caenorhabditis briggsae]|uniref:Protein CBG26719 n=1 Tax=Caenorhabditis briggsae TaxID=6238 RepID=B6IE91_CAEBR|nr:Protein CBG26719 [Caenorhabditis briggsae]CAS01155.1 Protein CBG26719 [Caenorhabditis briggsae]